jgi:hypothetical protein
MASILSWQTAQLSIYLQLWRVAGNHHLLYFGSTWEWIPVIYRRARPTPVWSSNASPHPWNPVLRCETVAFWQLINLFQRPGVSVINTASILCYMYVSFRAFAISCNTYFLNHLCSTWFQGRHLIDSSIALISKSLTLPHDYAFNLSTLLMALMGFTRLGTAFNTETAHECT